MTSAPQVFLLVGADQNKCDPLSSFINELVKQAKCNSVPLCAPPPVCVPPPPPPCVKPCCPRVTDGCKTTGDATIKSDADGNNINIKCNAPGDIWTGKTAFSAEASIDANGRTNAKIQLCSDKDKKCDKTLCCEKACGTKGPVCCTYKTPCCMAQESTETKVCRRNGLDPTPAELRGFKKFEYLPSNKPKCLNKAFPITDRVGSSSSVGSKCSLFKRVKQHSPDIIMSRGDCLKTVPEARLAKFSTCINRRDGLQDKCDPVAKRAIARCCKKSKC